MLPFGEHHKRTKSNMAEKPFYLSLNQAAKETGKAKATIHKALKDGRLSYIEKGSSGYKIDPAELFRVFPRTTDTTTNEQSQTPVNTYENTIKIKELELTVDNLQEKLTLRKEQIQELQKNNDDLREDRNHWRNQAERLALTHQTSPETPQMTVESQAAVPATQAPNRTNYMLYGLLWGIMALFLVIILVIVFEATTRT